MQNDPTLALNLAAVTEESRKLAAAITPGSARWDVIVVGSGAAGGMAAFQLAMAGVKVLLLEAGRMIDVRTEYRTMEWPYASMRRHRLPPGERPIGVAEYNFLDRPYGSNPALAKYKKVASVLGQHLHAELVARRARESDHGHAVHARPRADPRRADQLLGTRSAALRPAAVQGRESRRLRCRLADRLRRREAGTTTRSTPCSAAPAPTKGSCKCRMACFSGPPSSIASRSRSSARSRKWAAPSSRDAPASRPTAS